MGAELTALQALIDDAPFHRWLGIKAILATADSIELMVAWQPDFSGHSERHYVHGGILSSLVDLAGYYAVAVRRSPPISTVDLHVDFLRAAIATDLRVSASVENDTRALAWSKAQVFDAEGNVVAMGRGLYRTPDFLSQSRRK
ncbi:MAG: PaaI family thioesterase [Sphingomonadales bacterium]|nr:PaaI family thioesterase [Sphingomonadaceae bacterium]MBS3931444.1 PaaI family thioesterase [Sphingomonadales bacterium]